MKYFKLKFLLLFAALAVALPPAWAEEVTICDGDATTQYLPVYGYYFDWSQHNQMIYPASELADLPSGSFITSVTFYPESPISFSGAAITFSMANMAEGSAAFPIDNYGSADGPIDVALTQVASVMPTSVQPWTITFDDPFEYTGGDLIIDVVTNEGTDSRVYFTAKDLSEKYGYYSYGSYSKYLITQLPKATFTYEGEAKPYVAKVAPKSIDFGKLLPNEQRTENITLSNKGTNAFTPILSGLEGTPFSTTYIPAAIEPGAEVTVSITYNPTEVGNHDATLSITANESSDIALSVTLTGRCANDITVADGEDTQYNLPFNYPSYYTQKNQMIYPAADLTSLVGKKITGLTFYSTGINFDGQYNVALGTTTQSTFSSTTPIEGLTTVASNHTATPGVTEFVVAFDEPFTYNGDNLVIQTEVTNIGTNSYSYYYFYGKNQSSNTAYYWYNASYGDYGYVKQFLPKVTFDFDNGGDTPVEPDPVLVVDPDELDLDEATTFTVMGENLKGDVIITVDNANFTVTPATITKADAEEGATVTVAYTGTNTDGEIATITVASQGAESAIVTVMGAAPKPVTVEKPVFNPEDGATFEENLTVTLTCATTGANIQYSYNNEYFTDYTEPIVIDETTTIYAKAVLGEVESEVVSATYTKEAAPQPSDCPAVIEFDDNGTDATNAFADVAALKNYITSGKDFVSDMTCDRVYPGVTGIKFSASKNNGYLTINLAPLANGQGSWKTSKIIVNAKKYGSDASAISVNGSDAVSVTENYADYEFPVTSTDPLESITIDATKRLYVKSITIMHDCGGATPEPLQVKTPTFNPAQGEYTEAQNVTITCATEDAVIHYTVDGTDPPAESPVYAEAIAVGETTTIKAIAMKEGMTNSEIATATYTINIPSGEGKIYVKLTTDALTPGKKYIFVYEGEQAMAMGAFNSNSTKCNPVNVTINNNEVNIAGKDDIIEFTAGEGPAVYGSDIKQYTLALPSGQYLAYKGGTDFKLMTSTDTEAYWRIKTHDGGYTVYNASASGRSIQKNTTTNMFGPYADGQDLVAIYVEKSDEPVVEELTVALDPAEKTYTVGEEAKIMVNVENGNEDTMVSYKINDGEDQDYNAETGIVLPNDKAKEYTVTVYATDGDREATATGTYSFTAAPAFEITLTPNKEGNYTVGDNAVVTVAVDKYIGEDYLVTYTIGDSEEQIEYNAETGIVLPNDKAGDVTVKVYVTDGYEHAGDEFASATYHFDAAPAIVVTLDPASGNYYLGEQVKVTVTAQNTIGDYEVTYKIGDGEELDYEDGITITSDQEGTVNLTVTVVDGYHDGAATATGAYTFAPRPVVTMPTLSLVGGTYGEAQQLTITAENGATILYSTDGSEPTTEYTNAIALGEGTTTVKAIAMKDGYTMSPEVSATYIIEIPEELPTITAFDGYYQVKNNGNDKYANIAGRKTLNFTNDIDKAAGTVIRLKTNDKGQVQVLRSQAADLQRYADRAVEYYVPKAVELIAQKLQADGAGNILGENGLVAIMDKFNSSFDHHLYVEQAGEGWRIYGKTPSMQPVVDFYRENTSKVEQKLPMLESFINSALDKLKEKIGGSSVFQPFSLLNIWERMGGTLTKPEDDASIMAFYREVLNNKYYVWDFAYQTATFYIENLKAHPRWPEVQEQLGELAQYIDKIENVRPEFKYYIVQKDGKPDYISEGNADIRNNEPRTIWTVEPRTTFTVNFSEENISNKMYVTTLYTDFAYDLPEGVTAYKVTEISESSVAKQEAITGTVPAQTPVILMSTTAGDQALTLNLNDGTRPADNLLQGPDYLVNYYDFKTPQLVNLFAQLKNKLGEDFYNNYVKDYEYLMDLNSGTVNNKYFWNVNADLDKLTDEPIVRDLAVDDMGKLAFSDHWTTENNKAFLVDLQGEHNVIFLSMRGDVNKDGYINITDVTAWIDLKLETTPYQYLEPTAQYPNGLDYEAADYNENGELKVDDLADLIQFILMRDLPEGDDPETPVEP